MIKFYMFNCFKIVQYINLKRLSLSYFSGNHAYTEYSFLKLIIWKLGVIRRLLGDIKNNRGILLVNLNKLNKEFKMRNPKPALICATGLSLNEIDLKFMNDFRTFGAIFSINYFPLTEIGSKCKIDYQSLLDNGLFKKVAYDATEISFRKWMNTEFDGTLITSYGRQTNYKGRTIYIRGLVAPSFTKSINPMKVVGYPPYTTLFTVSTAIWLGYSPIYIIGLDSTQHAYLEVSNSGVMLNDHHAGPYAKKSIWNGRTDSLSVLSSNAFTIEKMKLFRKHNVFILGNSSHIDTLPRITPAEVLHAHKA